MLRMFRFCGSMFVRTKRVAVSILLFGVLCAPLFAADAPGKVSPGDPQTRGFAGSDANGVPLQGEYISADEGLAAIQEAVAAGQVGDPALRTPPFVTGGDQPNLGPPPCLTTEHVFLFEDSDLILTTNFANGQLFVLMADAANALIAEHGDNFDFVSFWINYTPHHTIGTAFYLGLYNDTQGLGLPLQDSRASFGLGTERVEGFIMMWNINQGFWQPGATTDAFFTRLVLAQEFEHRFAMFLPPLSDERVLQGDDASCGRSAHWSFRVDGQGSGMEIAEWYSESPAYRVNNSLLPNKDTNRMFSMVDLYLMGYVEPEEMDAGAEELRFMNNSCTSPYSGPISTFSAADIIATAGPRIPGVEGAQKKFKTGWVMIHLPGAPPTHEELTKATAIHEQFAIDWYTGTLKRGTMDSSLYPDCNCNGIDDGTEAINGGNVDGCAVSPDADADGDVDLEDQASFIDCGSSPGAESIAIECETFDYDSDLDVDLHDFRIQQITHTGDCDVTFTTEPAHVVACPGDDVSFSAEAVGQDVNYLWNHNGNLMQFFGGTTFELESVSASDAGVYGVWALGRCGMDFSDFAQLSIHPMVEVIDSTPNTNICVGDTLELFVEATGFGTLTYQWQLDETNIPGETGSTLTRDPFSEGDEGSYRCLVTDDCELDVFSPPINVVNPLVQISQQLEGGQFCTGESVFLFINAVFAETYQWLKDGEEIPGATGFFLSLLDASPDDTGTYEVIAIGMCDSPVSDQVSVEIIDCGTP